MLRVARIDTSHRLYPQECDLRERVLLRAVGLDMDGFRAGWPGIEEQSDHFVAVTPQHRGGTPIDVVVGCAMLIPADGKLMQMAVDPQRQGEGIGRMLVAAVEARAFGELGITRLYCHARDVAVGFYQRLGWRVEGDEFTEVGVPHHKMVLDGPGQS